MIDPAKTALPMPTRKPPRRWLVVVGATAAFGLTLALMVATEPKLAIAWDEGYTLGREARMRTWFRALVAPEGEFSAWHAPFPYTELVQQDSVPPPRLNDFSTFSGLFSKRAIRWFWPFAREEPHGHPPFYAIVGMVGDLIAPGWEILPRARLGPMIAFSLAAGGIFGFLAGRRGWMAAAFAAGAWALQPNLFGHGHYATLDGLLSSLWVGALLAFASAVDAPSRVGRIAWAVLFGVFCGWAADTKLTGWFLPIPFVVWTAWSRVRRADWALLIGFAVAVPTLFAFNPAWWHDPVDSLDRFFRSNLTRGATIPIPVLFLGRVYNTPVESLPWYNTVAWTLFVTPVGFLGFALVGAARGARDFVLRWWDRSPEGGLARVDPFGVLVLMHWGFLLLLRAAPHTPGHDGVRLFLPAFGMLAIASGLGFDAFQRQFRRTALFLASAALIEGVATIAVMMPVPLAYYSPIVGGPKGAAAMGMEPTYFWDGLTPDAVKWLNVNTPRYRSVRFSTMPTSFFYLRNSGRLTAPLDPLDLGTPAFYVVQNRPSAWSEADRRFVEHVPPAYTVEKLGVPLVWIFPVAGSR